MGNGGLGVIGLIIGVSVLTGGHAVAPGANTTLVGGTILACGVLLSFIGAWEALTERRQEGLEREAAVTQVERLARLKEQGALSEEEFALQKQQFLGEDARELLTSQLPRLAALRQQGLLTEDEFHRKKGLLLLEDELAQLARLRDGELLSDDEYTERRARLLGEGPGAPG